MKPVYRYVDGGIEIPVGPVSVNLHAKGDRICRHLMHGEVFEPKSLAAWAEIVIPDTVVFDVGAYSGLFAIAAAKLGAFVLAFEPMPQMHERAELNIRRNNVDVKLFRAAVSDASGEGVMRFSPLTDYTSGASLLRKSGGQERVELVTIDAVAPKDMRVSAIKIDVERAEARVIRGAAETIERHRPKMIVECLSPDLRAEVERLLPAYRVAAEMDVRNVLMEPRV